VLFFVLPCSVRRRPTPSCALRRRPSGTQNPTLKPWQTTAIPIQVTASGVV